MSFCGDTVITSFTTNHNATSCAHRAQDPGGRISPCRKKCVKAIWHAGKHACERCCPDADYWTPTVGQPNQGAHDDEFGSEISEDWDLIQDIVDGTGALQKPTSTASDDTPGPSNLHEHTSVFGHFRRGTTRPQRLPYLSRTRPHLGPQGHDDPCTTCGSCVRVPCQGCDFRPDCLEYACTNCQPCDKCYELLPLWDLA